jgi:flagellar biosynthesis GTPase FlhF
MPLDSMAPVPPQVSYQNSQLTIVAPNSTLGDILRAVRKQTGAEIEIPPATERVVTHLGPGPAREVIAELLNGSRFNYVILGSPADNSVLTRVVLVAKSPQENASANNPAISEQPQAGVGPHTGNPGARLPEPDANAANDDTDDAADQAAAEAEQQQQTPASSDQPAVKTPQQMLQEMQQRQLQMQQQQQQQGQPNGPGAAVPPPPPPPQDQR